MISFSYCDYFLDNHQPFVGSLNNNSLQERGIDILKFAVNSSTNDSQVEEKILFRINKMAEGSLILVKNKL